MCVWLYLSRSKGELLHLMDSWERLKRQDALLHSFVKGLPACPWDRYSGATDWRESEAKYVEHIKPSRLVPNTLGVHSWFRAKSTDLSPKFLFFYR